MSHCVVIVAPTAKADITVCDINPAMLEQGKAKAIDQAYFVRHYMDCRKRRRTSTVPSRSVDIYVIAFGLRNVTHIDKALSEAARALKPGGRFYCMEFSPGVARELKPFYDRYCEKILPFLGQFVAQDRDSYQYLAESIQKFPTQAALAKRMERAGLSQIKWHNLTGGIAVIHEGWRV